MRLGGCLSGGGPAMQSPVRDLSDPRPTIHRVTFHPWRALRDMPHVQLVWQSPGAGLLAAWCKARSLILMDPAQSQVERRCSLTHEIIHAERGDTDCHPSVHKEAARRLIVLDDLANALMVHGEDWPRVADDLWVDDDTLTVRLQHLHPSERGYLLRRLSMKEHVP